MKMRKFSLLVLLFGLFAASSGYAEDAKLWLESCRGNFSPRESVSCTIYLNTSEPMYAYQLEVVSDNPSSVAIEGVEPGADGFMAAYRIDKKRGILKVNGFVTETGVAGIGLRFLTLKLRALATGVSTIRIVPEVFVNVNGKNIGVSAEGKNEIKVN